jgi:hypothetical protein
MFEEQTFKVGGLKLKAGREPVREIDFIPFFTMFSLKEIQIL